jgi:hypothetical protein
MHSTGRTRRDLIHRSFRRRLLVTSSLMLKSTYPLSLIMRTSLARLTSSASGSLASGMGRPRD